MVFPTESSVRSLSPDLEKKVPLDLMERPELKLSANPQQPKVAVLAKETTTRQGKGISIFSDPDRATIKLSSTPPLAGGSSPLSRVDQEEPSPPPSRGSGPVHRSFSGRRSKAPAPLIIIGERPLVPTPAVVNGPQAAEEGKVRKGLPSNPRATGQPKPKGNYI